MRRLGAQIRGPALTSRICTFCRYFATQHDATVLVRAARLIAHIVNTPPFSALLDPSGTADKTGLLNHNLAQQSDAEIEAIVRDRVETLYHPTCTARMAPREDGGVVDPLLRVHGVEGLRVCDASVFPTITSGHTVSVVHSSEAGLC